MPAPIAPHLDPRQSAEPWLEPPRTFAEVNERLAALERIIRGESQIPLEALPLAALTAYSELNFSPDATAFLQPGTVKAGNIAESLRDQLMVTPLMQGTPLVASGTIVGAAPPGTLVLDGTLTRTGTPWGRTFIVAQFTGFSPAVGLSTFRLKAGTPSNETSSTDTPFLANNANVHATYPFAVMEVPAVFGQPTLSWSLYALANTHADTNDFGSMFAIEIPQEFGR